MPKARARARPGEWVNLHLWQMQPVRDLLVIASIIGVIYVGYLVRVVTVPLLLAMALAYLFEPLIRRMMRLSWETGSGRRRLFSRPGAVLSIIVLVLVVLVVPAVLGTGFAAVQAARSVSQVTTGIQAVQASVAKPDDLKLFQAVPAGAWRSIRNFIVKTDAERRSGEGRQPDPTEHEGIMPDLRMAAKTALDWLQTHGTEVGSTISKDILGGGAHAVTAAASTVFSIGYIVFQAFLTAMFFFFVSTSWGKVVAFWESLIPERKRWRIIELYRRMDAVIAGFVRGRLIIVFIMTVYMTLAYWLIGVPMPLIVGPVIGVLFIVPMIHAIGVPIAAALMWLNAVHGPIFAPGLAGGSGWWWMIFAPLGVYLFATTMDDYLLTPTIQGKTTEMAIPMILFASLAGGALGGIYGLLIAIPAAACLRILLQEVFWPKFRAWAQGRAQDFLPISRE